MSVVIRKVLPEEVAELKVISEDTFRETFAHDNTEDQLKGYFDTALSEEVLLDEITHEESRYFFILVDGEKAGFLKTNVGSAQTEQYPVCRRLPVRLFSAPSFHNFLCFCEKWDVDILAVSVRRCPDSVDPVSMGIGFI